MGFNRRVRMWSLLASFLFYLTVVRAEQGNPKTALSIYEFEALDIDGNLVHLNEKYKGNVVVVVNVARLWGLADTNYHQLEALYKKYKADGFRVAAFPCNQFASQEPGTNAEIKEAMKKKYGYTFDMFAKINVNGDSAHPLYKYMKRVKGGWFTNEIKWNYTKFLINRKGVPIYRSSPQTAPNSMEDMIVAELKKSA